jgi:hypothetical protein
VLIGCFLWPPVLLLLLLLLCLLTRQQLVQQLLQLLHIQPDSLLPRAHVLHCEAWAAF